jgi:hypothetical protein
VPLLAFDAVFVWPVVHYVAGTPVGVRVLERGTGERGLWVAVSWPSRGWDGTETEQQIRIGVTGRDYYRLTPGSVLPATRIGRGRFQDLDVHTDGQPADGSSLLAIGLLLPFTAGGLIVAVGELTLEKWLLARGRPARGVVRARMRVPEHTIAYEYWELGSPDAGASFRASMTVTSEQYERIKVGQAVTVLHTLWEPRLQVAYSLLPAPHGVAE